MFFISLLVLSVCIGVMLLFIHDRDEIHQLMAFLSGIVALVCTLVLMPPLLKGLLGFVFVYLLNKLCIIHNSFE